MGLVIVLVLVLVKCYDNKKVKSPYNCVIFPLTQLQVANQQKNVNLVSDSPKMH